MPWCSLMGAYEGSASAVAEHNASQASIASGACFMLRVANGAHAPSVALGLLSTHPYSGKTLDSLKFAVPKIDVDRLRVPLTSQVVDLGT